jgi:hypothetical protein
MRTFSLALIVFLGGCAMDKPLSGKNGQPVPPKVDFECKQRCGFYDSRQSIVGAALCMNQCVEAAGY